MDSDTSPSSPPRIAGADTDTSIFHRLLAWLRALRRGRNGENTLRESLEELIEEHDEATPADEGDEWRMMRNILALDERRIDDVMVPRADIVAVDATAPVADAVGVFRNAGHSRLPIYRETLDDIVGMVHVKDILPFWGAAEAPPLATVAREVLFVPPSMPVLDLMQQMQATRKHLAIVVDEYGGTDGLVTIEDLVEEIVGEIEDEHDPEGGPNIVQRSDGTLVVSARTPLEELEKELACDLLPEEEDLYVDTVGGLVFSLLGRVPQRGEVVRHPDGVEFEVTEADARRIKRLRVRPTPRVAGDG